MTLASIGIVANAYGVFYAPVAEAMNTGRAAAAFGATITGLVKGMTSPLVNRMQKKAGLRTTILLGSIMSAVSTILMAYTNNIWIYYVLSFFRGFGASWFYYPVVHLILGNWFRKGRSSIIGAAMSFSGVGGAIVSPVLSKIIETSGYRTAFIVSGIMIFLSCLPAVFFVYDSPERIGLDTYGEEEKDTTEEHEEDEGKLEYRFFSPVFLMLAFIYTADTFLCGIPQHFPGYAQNIGMAGTGSLMLSASMIGNLSFKFITGWILDRYGSKAGPIFMFGLTLVSTFMFLYLPKTELILLISSFLYGAIYGGTISSSATIRRLYGSRQYGKASADMSVFMTLGTAMAVTAVGAIYDLTGAYTSAFYMVIVLSVIGLILNEVIHRR